MLTCVPVFCPCACEFNIEELEWDKAHCMSFLFLEFMNDVSRPFLNIRTRLPPELQLENLRGFVFTGPRDRPVKNRSRSLQWQEPLDVISILRLRVKSFSSIL